MDGVEFFRTSAQGAVRRVLEAGNFSYCVMLKSGQVRLEMDFPRVVSLDLHAGDVVAISGLVTQSFSLGPSGPDQTPFDRMPMTAPPVEGGADLIVGVVSNESLALGSMIVGPIIIRAAINQELSRQVWRAADMLEAEYSAPPSPARSLVVRRLAEIILINMTRQLTLDSASSAPSAPPAGAERQVLKALDVIFESPNRRLSLISLSRAAGMSRTRFAESFKLVTGQTPAQVGTRLRLAAIARRMMSEKLSVGAAAEAAGYRSAAAFVRAFQREHGETPSRWRRKHAAELLARDDLRRSNAQLDQKECHEA